MKTSPLILSTLIALSLIATACGAPAATAAPTNAPATTVPSAQVPVTGPGITVAIGKSDALGSFLVDDKGMTLYLFTKDTPHTSTCYDKCATNWPPLLTTGDPVGGDGVDASILSTTQRTDGTTQVTYNGWPLYYYAKDTKAGDTAGQNVGDVWFVISPAGEQVTSAAATEAPVAGGSASVAVGKTDALSSFLVDDKGMTLYLFTKDTPNTTTCYDKCATNWPPLLTTGDPVAGEGLDASLFGTTQRTDGTTQVTYNGWPLYYYAKDSKAGDTTGQGVGDVWYVISPTGEQIK